MARIYNKKKKRVRKKKRGGSPLSDLGQLLGARWSSKNGKEKRINLVEKIQ